MSEKHDAMWGMAGEEIASLHAEIERLKELCEVRAEIIEAQEKEIAATIERCAQVLDDAAAKATLASWADELRRLAAEIRALKDKP